MALTIKAFDGEVELADQVETNLEAEPGAWLVLSVEDEERAATVSITPFEATALAHALLTWAEDGAKLLGYKSDV